VLSFFIEKPFVPVRNQIERSFSLEIFRKKEIPSDAKLFLVSNGILAILLCHSSTTLLG